MISERDANALLLLAWTRGACARMVSILRPLVGDRAAAERLAHEWCPRPLVVGDASPAFLPTGQPVPSASTPWPRELSPLPGVDFPRDTILELAADALLARMNSNCYEGVVSRGILSLVAPEQQFATVRGLARAWVESGNALACIRAALPPGQPHGWLSDVEMRELLEAMTSWMTNARWSASARRFIARGAGPRVVELGNLCRPIEAGQLPTGQLIPEHLLEEHRDIVGTTLSGVWVSDDTRARAREFLERGLPGRAVYTICVDCSCTPETGRQIVREMLGERSDHPCRALASISAAIERLLFGLPLHWVLLTAVKVVEDTNVPTVALGLVRSSRARQILLSCNPGFVNGLTRDECCGVLVHEINHVILDHLLPPWNARPTAPTDKDRIAWTIACECTANEYVPFPLPGTPMTIEAYRLPPGESTLVRYKKLRRRKGLRLLCEPGIIDWPGSTMGDIELGNLVAGAPSELRGPIEKALRGFGRAAGAAVEDLRPRDESSIPWRAELRRLAGRMTERYATRLYPNRRFPLLAGIIPGRRKRRTIPVLVAAIDTSGSMSKHQLEAIGGELHAITRLGVRIAVIECDTRIRSHRWLSPGERLTRVHGRGGTSFVPPFSKEITERYHPDAFVYFTDGQGPAPDSPPHGRPVLWVLSGRARKPAPWGRATRMDDGRYDDALPAFN